MAEVVATFSTREAAAKNACSVLRDIKPTKVEPYIGRLGDGAGKVVGIELFVADRKVARIRLDLDKPKGIHYNTEDWQQATTAKTASCIKSTMDKETAENSVLYSEYLKALDGISGDTIWVWWKTGTKPM